MAWHQEEGFGHDDAAFVKALLDAGAKFIVKRNLRREPRDAAPRPHQPAKSSRSA